MVHFSKLKLYGFKSFVDKTELDIGPGLNGVVGPNGCGKSNLVEALRWVMGEKSAKNMRGGGMEDVIFAGTSKRPARNMAQATVIIDNQDGTAPAPFNTASEIEISRYIERDKGSQYRVNGKAVRARDVNLLFAGTMTGANSPALVSQGRITEIIIAKPQDRRRILEESAGISGLHSRRHEAELRLRAADHNLVRLNDAMNDMRSRLSSLKRQSRQAERYKELNNEIRKSDLALTWIEWRDTHQKIRNERAQFALENDIVQSALQQSKDLEIKVNTLDATLPAIRKQDIEARAILQNFRVSMDRLDEDAQTKANGLKDAENRHTQLNQDLNFARVKQTQSIDIIEQSTRDIETLDTTLKNIPDLIETANKNSAQLKLNNDALSTKKSEWEQHIAVAVDGHDALVRQHNDVQNRLSQMTSKMESIEQSIKTLNDEQSAILVDIKTIPDITALETQIETLRAQCLVLEQTIEAQSIDFETAKTAHEESAQSFRVIDAEYNALNDLVARHNDANDTEETDLLLNHLNVHAGYEKAVSNALGHWITMAGMTDAANVYWQNVTCNTTAPTGYTALSDYLDAPSTLSTFFDSIGVCDTLPTTMPELNIGQTLVARDGGLMRWDGLIVKPSAVNDQTDSASMLFEQKNKLAALVALKTTTEIELNSHAKTMDNANNVLSKTTDDLGALKSTLNGAEASLVTARHMHDRLMDKQAVCVSQTEQKQVDLKSSQDELKTLTATKKSIDTQLLNTNQSAIEQKRSDLNMLNNQLSEIGADIDRNRTHLVQLKYKNDDIERQKTNLKSQIKAAQSDRDTYNQRIESIIERLNDTDIQIKTLQTTNNADVVDSKRKILLSNISEQQAAINVITIQLTDTENQYRDAQGALRTAESTAASAREKRALAQANVANAEQEMTRIQTHIQDKFELSPQSLEEQTLSLFDSDLPDCITLNQQRDDALKRRDSIGPVNLRASIESDETELQLADMETEHVDLTKAIAQLRGGISKLNREARERLAIAFKRVDTHFQTLFGQLFTGGKAYLEMIESEDPLDSGLEIYAQPPGKALQKLSLLSGGEQTLTATALIFAMFMTNPSPICVLDEIDAPLDDANVDRVCTLMENIARDTQTRFIVITHHRMTMARMDRLYGVTMSERGVSQLVSVDMALQDEFALNETA